MQGRGAGQRETGAMRPTGIDRLVPLGCYTLDVARQRTNVPPKLKQRLVDEAGGKYANPGCASYRTHIHHIKEWAVYATHDAKHMVAICPTCHDAVHHGPLVIEDETIRRWKRAPRTKLQRDHVYVEPGESSKLLLGSIAITGQTGGVSAFDLGPSTRLSFRIADADIMLMNMAISTTAGSEVLRVVDGHVRHQAEEPVRYERVPGHVRVTAPISNDFMPDWALSRLRRQEPNFASDGTLPLLDVEVMEPGLVRVQGIWNAPNHVVAITEERLAFIDPNHPNQQGIVALLGTGPDTVLDYVGPITTSLFAMGCGAGALRVLTSAAKIGRNDPCWCGSGKKYKKCHG